MSATPKERWAAALAATKGDAGLAGEQLAARIVQLEVHRETWRRHASNAREETLREVFFALKGALGKGEPQRVLARVIDELRDPERARKDGT